MATVSHLAQKQNSEKVDNNLQMQTNLLLRCMLLFPCSLWETKAGLFQFGIPVSRVTTRENDTVLKCICKIMLYDLLILCCSLFTSKLMNLENYD